MRGKKLQRWLWYAWEPRLKRIISHAFGERTTETLNIVLKRMENFKVVFWSTDKFGAYNRPLSKLYFPCENWCVDFAARILMYIKYTPFLLTPKSPVISLPHMKNTLLAKYTLSVLKERI
ncbi:MAG: IS1 family transposase [Candidatus Lariskella arthropodorum]